jgi:nucleoside-diphosphate-sugar epimerase
MRIAVTGGTGFVGGHLVRALAKEGHEVTVVSRGVDSRAFANEVLSLHGIETRRVSTGDVGGLRAAFAGCEAVAHCAGINLEVGSQTYEAVHVRGTENAVRAAEDAGVRRLALTSFLRARPACGSPYHESKWRDHESKWRAEEIARSSTLKWTVLKPGMMSGFSPLHLSKDR